jgi:hypothetical protein
MYKIRNSKKCKMIAETNNIISTMCLPEEFHTLYDILEIPFNTEGNMYNKYPSDFLGNIHIMDNKNNETTAYVSGKALTFEEFVDAYKNTIPQEVYENYIKNLNFMHTIYYKFVPHNIREAVTGSLNDQIQKIGDIEVYSEYDPQGDNINKYFEHNFNKIGNDHYKYNLIAIKNHVPMDLSHTIDYKVIPNEHKFYWSFEIRVKNIKNKTITEYQIIYLGDGNYCLISSSYGN